MLIRCDMVQWSEIFGAPRFTRTPWWQSSQNACWKKNRRMSRDVLQYCSASIGMKQYRNIQDNSKISVTACDSLDILSCFGHSDLVVRLLVSELVPWLCMKSFRKRDQHPPWCRTCSIHSLVGDVVSGFQRYFWMLPEILHCFQLYPAFCWGKNADVESCQIKHHFRKSWRLLKYKEHMKDIHPDHVYRRSFQVISNLVLSLFCRYFDIYYMQWIASWRGVQNEGSTLHII